MMPRSIALVMVLAVACGGRRPGPPAPENRELASLRALARLYGVVRWFHPTDEADGLDWNLYAVAGVRAVRGARDTAALRDALAAWVAPIGPTVQVLASGQVPSPAPVVDPALPQVAWQYLGPGFDGGFPNDYVARRTHRTGTVTLAWPQLAELSQRLDAAPLAGHRVRLHAQLRAGARAKVSAWLRVDRPNHNFGFFDDMRDRPVRSPQWTAASIEGPVAEDAVAVMIGGRVWGDDGWWDGFTLEVDDGRGGWTPVAVANGDLDDGTTGWALGIGGGRLRPAYDLTAEPAARDGGPAAHLAVRTRTLDCDLFPEHPAPGEVTEVELGDGLHARVPLSLPSADGHTVPRGNPKAAQAAIYAAASLDVTDPDVRIADVVVAWNVLAHFYPYHDPIARPWPAALERQLAEVLAEPSPGRHGDTLRHLIASVEDGQGRFQDESRDRLPVVLDLVEDKVVVIASGRSELARGDVITAIDGVPAAAALETARGLASGSPQRRTVRALEQLGAGAPGTSAAIDLERAGAALRVFVARGGALPARATYPPIGEVQHGIWLVDLSRAEPTPVQLTQLASARGIVFDVRTHTAGGVETILPHLLDPPALGRWMHVPHLIRPNLPGAAPPQWSSSGGDLAPEEPKLRGRVVFLTGPAAIGDAESVLGYAEALKLPIVGAATAGTNGIPRTVPLPSGGSITFTGMKVTRHDGTRSHLLGIQPTVPAAPTIAGIRAGKDEVLDRALDLLTRPAP